MCRTLWKIQLSVGRSAYDIGVANITFYQWSYSNFLYMFSWGDFFIAITIYIHSDKSLFQSEVKYRKKPVSCIAKKNVFVFTVGQLKWSSPLVCQ